MLWREARQETGLEIIRVREGLPEVLAAERSEETYCSILFDCWLFQEVSFLSVYFLKTKDPFT